jgi:tetratricopeptide (TPR) repeat protein
LDRGINAFNSKDYDGCINRMQDVLRLDARNTSAQYFLAEARKKKNEQVIEQEIETRLRLGQNAYQRGNYQESIKQADEVLKLAPGNASALSLLDRAGKKQEEKNTEQQIRDGLSKVQQAFRGENYEECITLANRVLSLDQENAQAKEYLNLANEKISMSQINALVNQYVQSVDSGKLLNFYESSCSSQCYLDVKKDAELVATYFSNLQSSAANVEFRFKGTDRAEVSFSNTISGTNKAGARQDVIKGVYKWDLQKQGKSWKIIRIEYTPRG